MCGINGIFAYHAASSAPEEAELLATRDAMRSRGPDGSGTWWSADRRCAFGHRRLSIIDLSERASQPMTSDDARFVVVFNGEIYNYPELRAELADDGVGFRTTSDTEALLHLYARYGSAMVHKLRGMYAFAIWDQPRRGLFLARDPYGIKPLYIANDGWTYRFASQVKALLAGGKISRDPEPAGIAGFHLFGNVPEPFTFYREIRALPPGHSQWIDSSGPREPKRFASLSAAFAAGAVIPSAPAEVDQLVRIGVLDSVRAHLLADVEVAVFLSAGVDSGALLGLMRDAGQHRIRAITLAFEEFAGTPDDEAPLAGLTCRTYGAEHVVRRISQREFASDLPAIFRAMDQPSTDGVNAWFVAKAAREVGLKVAISGLGGDEILAGYPSFTDLPRWRRRFGPFARVPGLGRLVRSIVLAAVPHFMKDRPKVLGVLELAGSWAGSYLLRRGLFLPHELPAVIGEELSREGLRRLQPLRRLASTLRPDPGSDTARVSVLESSFYMRDQLLRDADWAGMAHSLEIRVPLVDFKLLSALAPAMRALGSGVGKLALAKAPAVALPDEVISRAKTGFSVPTGDWMAAVAHRGGERNRSTISRGLVARSWSSAVLEAANLSGSV